MVDPEQLPLKTAESMISGSSSSPQGPEASWLLVALAVPDVVSVTALAVPDSVKEQAWPLAVLLPDPESEPLAAA